MSVGVRISLPQTASPALLDLSSLQPLGGEVTGLRPPEVAVTRIAVSPAAVFCGQARDSPPSAVYLRSEAPRSVIMPSPLQGNGSS